MSTEQGLVQDWFATLPPQDRADWLEVRQTATGIVPSLIQTLPPERQPGHAGAWVLGPVDATWLASPVGTPAYILAEEFGQFLAAEYDRWYSAG